MREEIRGFQAVKDAAKDFETYSSDLLGDRDVRSYRQLPLEADPPRHTKFRDALQPYFMSSRIEQFRPEFEKLAHELLETGFARGGLEVTSELALPYVLGSLGIIFNRKQDVEEWISWGPDVWTAEAYQRGDVDHGATRAHQDRDFSKPTVRSGKVLQTYLERVFAEALEKERQGIEASDLWDFIARIEVDGVRVNQDEMWGMANVLLAGGRDTVIKLISGFVWHLIGKDADRVFLQENPGWYNRAIAELARYLSPLPKMERAPREQVLLPDSQRDVEKYVLLNFASANHDPGVWQNPDEIDIHRERKPHLAFGFGRHSCLGMNVTEIEVSSFLSVFLNHREGWRFAEEPDLEWVNEKGYEGRNFQYLERFNSIRIEPR